MDQERWDRINRLSDYLAEIVAPLVSEAKGDPQRASELVHCLQVQLATAVGHLSADHQSALNAIREDIAPALAYFALIAADDAHGTAPANETVQ